MAKRKKLTYQEIIEVIKNNPDITGAELGEIFKKDTSWGRRLKKFYFATVEEKEQLTQQHHIFKAFYNLYIEYLKTTPAPELIEEEEKEEESVRQENAQEEAKEIVGQAQQEEIPENIQELIEENKKLKQMVVSLAVELNHLRESNKGLMADNCEKGLNINRAINTENKLTAKLNKCSSDLKYYKVYYWIMLSAWILEIIIVWAKG